MPMKRLCQLKIATNEKAIHADFYVVSQPHSRPLLGLESCQKFHLITVNKIQTNNDNDPKILNELNDVFTGLGQVTGEYHVELKEDAQPKIHPPRKVPLHLMSKLKETLAKLEKTGIISKSKKPSDWVNSLVTVEKKDRSLHLCLYPKDLNKAIKKEYYKSPSIEIISSKLSGKNVFTVIDKTSCYWYG